MKSGNQPKNIMLISLDDAVAFWKYKTVFGQELQTPNLDRICAQSTAFHSAYCQAPVCGPSRASFMSGKTPHQSGVFENKTKFYNKISPKDMWPAKLKNSGYFCSSGGKVHHGYKPLPSEAYNQLYSDEPKYIQVLGFKKLPPKPGHVTLGGWRSGYATTYEKDDGIFYDAKSADSAIEFLKDYSGDDPFYREVGFFSPHGPYLTPLRYKEMYHFKKFKQPAAWARDFPSNAYADEHLEKNFPLEKQRFWRQSIRNYYSALTHVDHHLGRVWDALKLSPHAENTVVLIVSDHGFHLGDRRRFRKTTLWEQVANVPLILHDPGNPEGRVVEDPVALLDVGPTILDFAGVSPTEDCVGRSLRKYLDGYSDPDRPVPTFHFDNAGVRVGKYRFIQYEDDSIEFYDLEADPWQQDNLGTDHQDYQKTKDAFVECCLEYGLDLRRRRDATLEQEGLA